MLATLLAFACLPASAYDRYGNRAMQGSTPTPAVAPLCVTSANPGCNSSTTALTPAYTASNNRLNSTWATYDAAGNMLAFKDPIGAGTRDWSAAYDAENKQRFYCDGTTATCSASNDTAEYVYDGEGNRVKKIASGETVTYVYDAFGRLAAEYSTAGPSGTAGSYFRTTDHLGSTRLVTDENGDVYDRRDFFPFGEKILASSTYSNRHYVSGYNDSNPASAHLFTAKERDQESGLDYFGERYYDPLLGRFTGDDPGPMREHDPQSINRYAAVRNNPLRLVDRQGAYWEEAYGTFGEIRVNRDVPGMLQFNSVSPGGDNALRKTRGDTNDQIQLPIPYVGGILSASRLFEGTMSTLGETSFTRPFKYSYREGVELDEQVFEVAESLLGKTQVRDGGQVYMAVGVEGRAAFRRIHRGVRIRSELQILQKRLATPLGGHLGRSEKQQESRRQTLERDIAERKEDEDYRYLLQLEAAFTTGNGQ